MRVSGRRRLYEDTWKGRQRINVSGKENIERGYVGRESYIYVLLLGRLWRKVFGELEID